MSDVAAQAWLEQYKGKIPEIEMRLLERAKETLLANIVSSTPEKPVQWAPYRGILPSAFRYRGVWNWDCAFHAIGAARWDIELARDQIRIFLDNQLPNGGLPDVLCESGERVTDFGKPPVMPWACAIVDRISPDDDFLRYAYDKFVAYEAHWRRDRGGDRDGLFHYDSAASDEPRRRKHAKLESGWDTSVRWDKASYSLWAVDLNCFMVMLYRAMAYMAERLGEADDHRVWLDRADILASNINEKLWNPKAGAYMDYDYEAKEFNDVLSPASFHPLYVRIASEEQAAKLAELAADPSKFCPGMPTVTYDHPEYKSGDYWRGPAWLNVSYFAVKGLKEYGYEKITNDIRQTLLGWCSQNEDYLYEYYDSNSGAGIGAKQYGWTATFVIEFILNW